MFEEASPSGTAAPSSAPQPLITFIDSPNVQCIHPDPRQDACFVNWGYSSVSASPNYMIAMWISLNGKVVARIGGFFQTSMSVSASNMSPGYRLPCGPPVDDPADPATPKKQVGNSYSWDIKAKDSANLSAANYGTVTCPAYFTADGAAALSVSPGSLTATQATNTTTTATLSIGNTAAFDLSWSLPTSTSTGCAADGVPWLSLSSTSGMTAGLATDPVTVTFDSSGLAPGHYPAHVCVSSSDTFSPQIDVPVALTVSCPVGPAAAISAPSAVGAGSPNRIASVPNHAGSTFAWTIGNGTITAGQGTHQITFTAGAAGSPVTLSVVESNPDPSICIASPGSAAIPVVSTGKAILFYTVPPCRVLDTRTAPNGPLAGPPLQPGATRSFDVDASSCGIPAGARGVSVNATVTSPGAPGFVTLYPGGGALPPTSTINFSTGQTRANNAVVVLAADGSGTVNVTNGSAASVHFILDVNGYFQ